jgi:hypothetical protein
LGKNSFQEIYLWGKVVWGMVFWGKVVWGIVFWGKVIFPILGKSCFGEKLFWGKVVLGKSCFGEKLFCFGEKTFGEKT